MFYLYISFYFRTLLQAAWWRFLFNKKKRALQHSKYEPKYKRKYCSVIFVKLWISTFQSGGIFCISQSAYYIYKKLSQDWKCIDTQKHFIPLGYSEELTFAALPSRIIKGKQNKPTLTSSLNWVIALFGIFTSQKST